MRRHPPAEPIFQVSARTHIGALVLWFNQHEPRSYEGPNNLVIADGVRRHPNARLIDWHTAGNQHPSWFGPDGIHLTWEGRQAMADLIHLNLPR